MINAVSGVGFRGTSSAQDLINSPGLYTRPMPTQSGGLAADTFEGSSTKKKSGTKKLLLTLGAGLAAFATLGYLVKSGKLAKVDVNSADNFFKKMWTHTKNASASVGDYAVKAWDAIAGLFGKKASENAKSAVLAAVEV